MPRVTQVAKLDHDGDGADSFLARMRSAQIFEGDMDFTRQQYGEELPDDVIEVLARQAAIARPILEKYHLMAEQTPTLALAKAAMIEEMDEITDVITSMDLNDLGDVGELDDEYACPRCAHRWSGAPNFRTGYGDRVYIPTGRISRKTGHAMSERFGAERRTSLVVPPGGRRWKGASQAALPRGFGNRSIGQPLVAPKKKR